MKNKSKGLIDLLIIESKAYSSIGNIEVLVQEKDLSVLPLQPLYSTLKQSNTELVAQCLPKMSPEQRKLCLDLDLWQKDEIDVEGFDFWLEAYNYCEDDKVSAEFVKSSEFAMFLKSRLNIWTFDVEDPRYPDHDYYFLTDDNLLLVEYDENFSDPDRLKNYINRLYLELGVDDAYSYLFKIVVDSFLDMQETEYYHKKERMRDYGFVDYFDALKLRSHFPSIQALNNFIDNKVELTGEIDVKSQNQVLDEKSLTAFKDGIGEMDNELAKLDDSKRESFLQFNFIQLINGTMSLTGALKKGSVAVNRVGLGTKKKLFLGFAYIKDALKGDAKLFQLFDFSDLYKVGHTLITLNQNRLKKVLNSSTIHEGRAKFVGNTLEEFLDSSFQDIVKVKDRNTSEVLEVLTVESYRIWDKLVDNFCSLYPYIEKFFEAYVNLKNEDKLSDHFYMNYKVEDIDFEAVLLSLFVNFSLGHYDRQSVQLKMGVSSNELKTFGEQFVKNEKLRIDKNLTKKVLAFRDAYGLGPVEGFERYLYFLLDNHLSGYDFSKLKKEDFNFIGGPIIINN